MVHSVCCSFFRERLRIEMTNIIEKMEKQIASLQSKIEALSGDYLTNTRKRQQEQRERDKKKDDYRMHI